MATSIDTKGQGSSLVALPQEILIAIAENLADKDHSALTKTCRYMAVVLQESLFQRTNAGTYKAMDYASKRPDKDLITERALLYGFPPTIDTILGHGKTALGVAAFRGCREAVQALIKQGADVNAQGKQAIPPLGHAIHAFKLALGRARKFRTVDLNSYVGVISDLLDAGADPNCEILQPPGYNPVTVHPLQQVHDVTCRTSERTSQREVFRVKGWRGWEERVIKLLLQKGANPNLTGHYSLLSWFVERQEINYVLLFLAHGADPNLVDGDTAHPLAGCFLLNCRTNFPTLLADLIEPVALLMMHELLRRGANPMCDVGLPGRCRPLSMLASDSVLRPAPPGLLRAIDMLIEAGADVNHADRDATDSVTTNFGDWAPKTPVLTALMGPMVRSTDWSIL